YTHRWVPIEKWVKSDMNEMTKAIAEMGKKIGRDEKWKMDFNKRQYDAPKDIIIKLTDPIDRPHVDLKNPDKIVHVEVIGKNAGISLLNKDEVLNTATAGR
ncbi:MAG: THUMP domain-containing protein, partial [Candidatus Aenigmarchaeota archaeon]|nr:THUMP domain-containing protein [Candidatus Aenigmarchaeota archaeon]